MTKFEEELKKVANAGIDINRKEKTYYERDILRLSEGWVSPEEHRDRVNELIEAKEKYTKLLYENSSLKSQLQQQALPVVPECVGNFLSGKSIFKIANGDIPDDVISWVQEQTYYVDLEKIISHLIILKVTGFTVAVEKPQLFYLKHIDMSKHSRYFDFYLEYDGNESMEHKRVDKGEKPGTGYEKSCYTFTQQEIDSMNAGNYEQIEVTE